MVFPKVFAFCMGGPKLLEMTVAFLYGKIWLYPNVTALQYPQFMHFWKSDEFPLLHWKIQLVYSPQKTWTFYWIIRLSPVEGRPRQGRSQSDAVRPGPAATSPKFRRPISHKLCLLSSAQFISKVNNTSKKLQRQEIKSKFSIYSIFQASGRQCHGSRRQ